jgi:hypothetical protein
MRDSSVFTFLKSKYENLYDLCTVMEKLIVLERYGLAMAVAKIILDLFCRQTKRELVFTIDVFNDDSKSSSDSASASNILQGCPAHSLYKSKKLIVILLP